MGFFVEGDRDGLDEHEALMRERHGPEPEQVHIVGPALTVHGVERQRCMWCGALLLEHDLANMAVSLAPGDDPENPPKPATWEVGALLLVTGTFPRVSMALEAREHPEGGPEGAFVIPDNACMALDVDVTR